MRSFIHLPAPGVGGVVVGGNRREIPPPQPRVGGAQGRHPGAGAYSGCPLRRSWLLGSLLGWGQLLEKPGAWSKDASLKPGNSPRDSRHVFRKHAAIPIPAWRRLSIGSTRSQYQPMMWSLVRWRDGGHTPWPIRDGSYSPLVERTDPEGWMYPAGVQSKPGGGNFSLVRSGSEFGALWGRRLGRPGRPGCGVQARFLRLRLERANFFLFLPEGEASLIGDHSLPHWQGRNQGNSGLEDAIMLSPAFSMQEAWSPAPVDWKPSFIGNTVRGALREGIVILLLSVNAGGGERGMDVCLI